MATAWNLVKNGAWYLRLNANIADSDTSFSMASGEGAALPTLSGSDTFYLQLVDSYDTNGQPSSYEIIKVGAISTDALSSITRAQGGTSASAHIAASCDVHLVLVAGNVTELQDAVTNIEDGTTTLTTVTTSGAGTIGGALAVNGAAITTDDTTFALLNTTVTTINIGGAATTINAGVAGGTFNMLSNLNLGNGAAITTDDTTFALLNTTVTTINIGGAATTINAGVAGGTFNILSKLNLASVAAAAARAISISVANDASSQSQLHFQTAGANKWLIYKVGNVDNLRIYSYTNGADVITFGTGGVDIAKGLTVKAGGAADTLTVGGADYSDGTTTTCPSDTAENTLKSRTVPAGMLDANGQALEFDCAGEVSDGAAGVATTVKLKIGGVTITTLSFDDVTSRWRFRGKVIRTGAATQTIVYEAWTGSTPELGHTTGAITLTGTFAVAVTATKSHGSNDTVTQTWLQLILHRSNT